MFRTQSIFRSIAQKPGFLRRGIAFGRPYIIDTDIGGDIDDSIALLLALSKQPKPLAITTTHIDPEEKARIAKLIVSECGHPHIPVFAGIGSKRTESKKEFLQKNSLFPPAFGFPNSGIADKKWYEKQGQAYREHYLERFENLKIEAESAPQFIVRMAEKFSEYNKLTIVCLGPLHNIEAALKTKPSIAHTIRLVAMGGTYPKGYNWLISPETSSFVLSRVETLCIDSEFIARNKLCLSQNELRELEFSADSHFGKTFIQDWKNWHKGDVFAKQSTYLYDPVTLFLALHPEEILSTRGKRVLFPCLDASDQLKPEYRDSWYYKPGLENKIICLEDVEDAKVFFVEQIQAPEKIKNAIFNAVKDKLSTSLQIKAQSSLMSVSKL